MRQRALRPTSRAEVPSFDYSRLPLESLLTLQYFTPRSFKSLRDGIDTARINPILAISAQARRPTCNHPSPNQALNTSQHATPLPAPTQNLLISNLIGRNHNPLPPFPFSALTRLQSCMLAPHLGHFIHSFSFTVSSLVTKGGSFLSLSP